MTRVSQAALLAALFVPALARAQTAPPTPVPDVAGSVAANAVEAVVVTANRSAQSLDKVGQSISVLTLPDIRADQETQVVDLLTRTPGVSFSRNGGPGAATSLRIRGAETDQTAVLIDGVKLNDPSSPGGGFNFGDLTTSDISRIEVLRGPQSTLYGSQAIGGVVNIVTADPTRPLEGDAQVEGGSYDTAYAKAGVGGRQGGFTFRGAVSSYVTSGVSAFDQRLGGKEADGDHNTAITGRLGYAFSPNLSVDGRVYYAEARTEFDGFPPPNYAFADDPEFGRTQELVAYAGLNAALLDGRLKNRFALQYTDTERQNLDPTQAVTPFTFLSSGINTRGEYQGAFEIAPGYTAVFGAERERSSFVTSAPNAFDPSPASTRSAVSVNSGYGQLQAEVIPGLNLTGGVRYDDHSTFGGHATGQVAAAWSLPSHTVLRASWGQGFKAPTLYQLYSDYGNLALNPEEAEAYDLGVEQAFWDGRAQVQVTYFNRDSDNLITFVSCPFTGPATGRCVNQPFGYYDNVAKAHADGVELSGSVKPVDGLTVDANYTYTDARDRSPGAVTFDRLLARRPQDQANVTASYVFPFRLTTSVAVRAVGRSFDNAANTVRLKGYTLVDFRASYPLGWRGLEVYGRIENAFDRSYETTYGYGSLGRAIYGGLRATF